MGIEKPHSREVALYIDHAQQMLAVAARNLDERLAETGRMAMNGSRPALPLSMRERKAVQTFIEKLYRDYGSTMQQAILFGSKARGDSQPDSDIDILIIVEDESWQLRAAISLIVARLSLEHGVLLGPRVIGRERWRRMERERFSFCVNIAQEGIPLTPQPV